MQIVLSAFLVLQVYHLDCRVLQHLRELICGWPLEMNWILSVTKSICLAQSIDGCLKNLKLLFGLNLLLNELFRLLSDQLVLIAWQAQKIR